MFGAAVPHPRSYGTFGRVLGVYVRERHVLTLRDAIRRMSGIPAQRLNFVDRGLLRPGMKADIVVFDPERVADRATFEDPHEYSVGFRDVIVNGCPVLRDGQVTSQRPGRVPCGSAKIETTFISKQSLCPALAAVPLLALPASKEQISKPPSEVPASELRVSRVNAWPMASCVYHFGPFPDPAQRVCE